MTIGKKTKKALQGQFVRSKTRIHLTPGDVIKILREKHGLTQLELASRASLTQATVSSLEKNRIQLGVERAKALARVLKVHPAVLLFPDWDMEQKAA